jgi:hypothetical protein
VRNSLTVVSAIAIPFLRLWGVEGYYSPERLRVLLDYAMSSLRNAVG